MCFLARNHREAQPLFLFSRPDRDELFAVELRMELVAFLGGGRRILHRGFARRCTSPVRRWPQTENLSGISGITPRVRPAGGFDFRSLDALAGILKGAASLRASPPPSDTGGTNDSPDAEIAGRSMASAQRQRRNSVRRAQRRLFRLLSAAAQCVQIGCSSVYKPVYRLNY